MNKVRKKEGVALITTLLVIALLVSVVVEFNRTAIADIEISRNYGDDKKILYFLISGVNAIKEFLKMDAVYSKSDHFIEKWADTRSYFEAAGAMLEEGKLEGRIIDENGKININYLVTEKGDFNPLHKQIWERLLAQPRFNLTEEQINTIVHGVKDWLDKDDKVTGIYGVEDAFYADKGYHPKNGSLDTLEEMLLINGITEDVFYGNQFKAGIQDYFTIYGSDRININTAPVPVLMALSENMTEETALQLDEFRRDEANRTELNTTGWYKKLWPYALPLPEQLITVSSGYFTISVKGTMRESMRRITAVVSRSETRADIVYWKEM